MTSHPNRSRRAIWASQEVSMEMLRVGDEGFLIERTGRGETTLHVWAEPAQKNLSKEPCENGWCGETNGVSITARGRVRVVRAAAGGERLQVVAI
jgi:hypothetical protein